MKQIILLFSLLFSLSLAVGQTVETTTTAKILSYTQLKKDLPTFRVLTEQGTVSVRNLGMSPLRIGIFEETPHLRPENSNFTYITIPGNTTMEVPVFSQNAKIFDASRHLSPTEGYTASISRWTYETITYPVTVIDAFDQRE